MRDVLTYPNEELLRMSSPIESPEFGTDMEVFIEEMYRIMEKSNGVGLAAPQVGVHKNVLVYRTVGEDEEKLDYLINPRIVEAHGKIAGEEGCLSIPGVFAKVTRAARITIEAQRADGEVFTKTTDAFSSIIIQHEMDHLIGKLFIYRLSPAKRNALLAKYKREHRD